MMLQLGGRTVTALNRRQTLAVIVAPEQAVTVKNVSLYGESPVTPGRQALVATVLLPAGVGEGPAAVLPEIRFGCAVRPLVLSFR